MLQCRQLETRGDTNGNLLQKGLALSCQPDPGKEKRNRGVLVNNA